MISTCKRIWRNFQEKHLGIAQFLVFLLLSNGVTVLQMFMMPMFRSLFASAGLVDVGLQVGQVGRNFDGSLYYIFNYAAGEISHGGGGGLAYFFAVQVTMAIAQAINFFTQRSLTFKSNSSVGKAVFWYAVAYVAITIGAAAAQGLYKAPIYNLLINTWGWGETGERVADIITVVINAALSFWIFFPIFRVIFKSEDAKDHLSKNDITAADSESAGNAYAPLHAKRGS